MKSTRASRLLAPLSLTAAVAALLAACSSTPLPRDSAPPAPVAPAATPTPAAAEPEPVAAAAPASRRTSDARTPRAYRQDAAAHLYHQNTQRIFKGRLPPMLYAVAVMQVEVDRHGNVGNISWMRAPRHAPEVMAEIERTVRAAAPFPAPVRLGKVVYTDTWLWHKSGQFQLDTLTEGQD